MLLVVREALRVIAEKPTIGIIVPMDGEACLATHSYTLRRGRHRFVEGNDERVALLIREVVVLPEHGELDGAEMAPDFGEREPTDLDEAEECPGRHQAVVLRRVAHVPVGGDERRDGVEHLGRLARVGKRLVGKVTYFDACCVEGLHAFFVCEGQVQGDFCWDGRDGVGMRAGGWLDIIDRGSIIGIKGEIRSSYWWRCNWC